MAAQNPYSPVQSVDPNSAPPDDYQHIQATPESFGALSAEGRQKLGAGETAMAGALEKTNNDVFSVHKFYGQIAADNGSNDFMESTNNLVYGDPNKKGPDGQPDTGYMGLRGADAMRARPQIETAIDDKLKEIRSTLTSPEQQLQFDNFSRRYRTSVLEKIGAHADGQMTVWGQATNDSMANVTANTIANNADSDDAFNHGVIDMRRAFVQNAHLKGGSPDMVADAVQKADQMSIAARLNAIAVKDPARALALLDKNKDMAGVTYDNLANTYRSRAQLQIGNAKAAEKWHAASASNGIEMPPNVTAGTVKNAILGQESGNRSNIGASIDGAQGPGQIMPATFQQYARPGEDIHNPIDNREVSGRIIDDYMRRYNGDAARVAVAYFSGPGNVSAPGAPTPWIKDTHDGNGKSVSGYVGDVAGRVGGNAGGPDQIKSKAFKMVMDDPELQNDPITRSHAITAITQEAARQDIAENQGAKAAKEASDKAAGGYTTEMYDMMHSANPDYVGLAGRINHDPTLDWRTKDALMDRVKRMSGEEQSLAFGPGYLKARQALFSTPETPGHLNDFSSLVQDPSITTAGLQDLKTRLSLVKGNVDRSATERIVNSFLTDAKRRLSFEAIDGPIKIMDPKGEHIFNNQFMPMFIKRVSELQSDAETTGDHSKLDKFLDPANVDKMITAARNPREMAVDKLNATGEADPLDLTVPAAPDGVDQKAWNTVLSNPPQRTNGTAISPTQWGDAISILRANPSPDVVDAFNRRVGPSGYTADQILQKFPPVAGAKASNDENLLAADKEMHLTPQEKDLYQRHLTNLYGSGGVDNPDGSRSSLYQSVQEHDGKFYNIPTVWDGKIETEKYTDKNGKVWDVPNATALANVEREGWDKFPSYSTPEEADKRYDEMHKYMEMDTKKYLGKNGKRSEAAPDEPNKPGILSRAVENVLHYGKTGTSKTTEEERAKEPPVEGAVLGEDGKWYIKNPETGKLAEIVSVHTENSKGIPATPTTMGIRG